MNGHGGQVWNERGERTLRLDFSANLWPERGIPLPKNLRDLLEPYPEPACRALLRAASGYYQVPEDNILAVNGASEGLDLVMRVLRPRRAAVFAPAFSEYEGAARRALAEVEVLRIPTAPDNDFVPVLGAPPSADVVVLGNPNNPTGTLLARSALDPWLEACAAAGAWVLADEAFLDFVPDPERFSLLADLDRWPRLIVLRSMTKRFGIAGVRLGFAMAVPATIARLREAQTPWSVNTLAQRIGTELARRPPLSGFAERIATEREYLTRALRRLGCRVFPAAANFVLFQMPEDRRHFDWIGGLREQGIGLRGCADFAGLDSSYARCAVRPRTEIRELVRALEALR